ncbi:hypothetical protein IMCC3317_21990 [Kordia antarctica]|uniref:Uncharacterized protein n=1 Tax=Kordia antarctica TaxID=1218801 RepID=A0A7L4ZK74_9FLAO|nr:hypothetical protein [Kordia antarctica]QHI36829.1 hypothetical protein IMCC3317_21990 [Kordia antarctica]
MIFRRSHIFNIFKHITFVLVVCVMILQPISEVFSCFSDINYELVDIDWEDDTEEKEGKEGKNEKNKKIEHQFTTTTLAFCNLSNTSANHYLQQSKWSCHLEILIPPPRQA